MKFLNYFLLLLLAVALVVGCEDSSSDVDEDTTQENLDNLDDSDSADDEDDSSSDNSDGSDEGQSDDELTANEATVSFQLNGSEIEATDTLTIGNSDGATLNVFLISNQDISTYEFAIESSDTTDWCDPYMSDTTVLTVTTPSKNVDYEKRIATITVTVGSGDDTASASLNIVQYPDEPPYITLSSQTLSIANYVTASDYVTFESNQPTENITVVPLDGASDSIFSYTVGSNKLTFEAKSINKDTETISETFVVAATLEGKIDTDTITVTQAAFVPATLSFSPTSVELTNEVGSSGSVEVTTNQATSSIKAEVADSVNYEVSVSGTKVTVKSLSVNNAATAVTVYVGDEDNNTTNSFAVTQSSEVRLSVDTSSIAISKDGGSTLFQISTNQPDANVSYELTTGDIFFTYSVVDGAVSVNSKSSNETASNYTGTLKISVDNGVNSDFVTVPIVQTYVSIGDFVSEGLVFWISDDMTYVKIVHPSEENPVQWYAEETATVLVGADSDYDGEYNMEMIKSASDYSTGRYEIVDWCEFLGEGWYLPARLELCELLEIASGSDFAAALTALNGDTIAEEYHWSSTETSASHAYCPRYKSGELSESASYGKYNSSKGGRYVRAIKKVTLQ